MAKSQVIETKRILHTPSDFAKSTLFYVQEAGRLRSLKSHVSRREHLDSFLFLIVLSGEGAVTYRDRRYHLRPATACSSTANRAIPTRAVKKIPGS